MNHFNGNGQIIADHRYCILNDDDAYEEGFFEHIDKVQPGWLMVVSMKRGHNIPAGVAAERAHGTDTLEACPANMTVGRVGAEQLISIGEIWQKHQFNPESVSADGERICELLAANPAPMYVPDAFVLFNYLEPGRWNK